MTVRIPIDVLRELLEKAEKAGRPVDVDWTNRTVTILEHDEGAALKLYVIRDYGEGNIRITDRT